jgi:hypothetical protein
LTSTGAVFFNMAQPIIDEQFGQLAIDQNWRDTLMKLHLASLLVDTKVVQIDKASYYAMHPNGDANNMDKIEKSWKIRKGTKRRVSTVAKQGAEGASKKPKNISEICGSTYGSFATANN